MRLVMLVCGLILSFTSNAYAWGNQGHQAVAEAAQVNLDDNAERAIATLLGHGFPLPPGTFAELSTWPDELRTFLDHGRVAPGWDPADKDEAITFNRNHKQHRLWHFVNLPLKAEAYPDLHNARKDDPVVYFTRPDDIVHMINTCIELLEAKTESATFTRVQALRWLLHLVGDLHQPLHVTSGYYSSTNLSHPKLITEPAEALTPGVVGDRGGNGLLFSRTKDDNLHALWDRCLVELVGGARSCSRTEKDYRSLARKVVDRMKEGNAARFKTLGDHHRWAEQWATDSLKAAVAARAYGVTLHHGVVHTSDQEEPYLESRIRTPPRKIQYGVSHLAPVSDQLTKAAVRLADLLNQINWK
jgi:hypothetical protein